jgi:hypothetical protein
LDKRATEAVLTFLELALTPFPMALLAMVVEEEEEVNPT